MSKWNFWTRIWLSEKCKLWNLTDLNKSEFKCAKNTCQTMLVMNKKINLRIHLLFKLLKSKEFWNQNIFWFFNCRCHKTPEETMTHDKIFQLPISQAFLAIGSFESGFQGNPIWGLLISYCYHPIHPRHKYLEWHPPE